MTTAFNGAQTLPLNYSILGEFSKNPHLIKREDLRGKLSRFCLNKSVFEGRVITLAAHSASNGIQTPFATYQGRTRPLFAVVFFRLKSVYQIDLLPIMVDCYGRMLSLLGVIISGLKPLQSATQRFRPLLAVYPHNQGITAMKTNSGEITPQNPNPNLTHLKQSFIALLGSYSYLFTVDGQDKSNNALSYDLLIDSAQSLIEQAQTLKAQAEGVAHHG